MRHKNCPACGEPVDTGSHWDCVFDLLAEWVKSRELAEELEKRRASGDLGGRPVESLSPVALHIEGVTEKEGE
jgi:hypothetical protein